MRLDGVVWHPMGLLNRLIERAKTGRFVPNRSLTQLPTKTASNGNLTRAAVNGSASSSSSRPRIASEIAMRASSNIRSKFDPVAK